MEKQLTDAKAIAQFAIANAQTPAQLEAAKDRLAAVELCEQYFTNPEFAKALGDYVWNLNR